MSGTNVSLDDAKEAKSEARQGNLRDNDAGIPDDLAYDYEADDAPIVQLHPEVLVTFSHVAGLSVFNTDEDFLQKSQNLQGAGPNGWGNDVILTLADPEVVDGQVWAFAEDGFKDYKIIGDPEDEGNHYETRETVVRDDDGNVEGADIDGVNFGMTDFDGQPAEGALDDYDYVQVLVSSSRAEQVLGVLDTAGKWARDPDTDELTEGLLEVPPSFGTEDYSAQDDPAPRCVGYPELRTDMVAQRGAISATFDGLDDGESSNKQTPWSFTVYKLTEDGLEALTSLTPEDDAYALPTYPRGNNFYWDEDADVSADATPQTTDGIDEARQAMSGDEVDYDILTDDEQDFVDEAVEAMATKGFDTVTEFDDFEERLATVEGDIVHESDDIATIIDAKADT